MKKWQILIIVIVVLLIAIGVILLNKKQTSIVKNDDYYTITISSAYSNYKGLGKEYEIVKEKSSLNQVLSKIENIDSENIKNIFNKEFFENQNLIIIDGGINAKVNKLEINNKSANIVVYYAVPLIRDDEVVDFKIYLIPINKNIDNINVEVSAEPDVLW